MNLYVLRHGIAVDPGTPGFEKDADRILTAEGERKLRLVARAMHSQELTFDRIISSPYLRAWQTAAAIAASYKKGPKVELQKVLTPEGTIVQVIEMLRRLKPAPENVLVVGHEPGLSGLVSALVGCRSGSAVVFKKGGLCKVAVLSLRPQPKAAIEWLLTPRQMAVIARSE